MGIIHSSGCTSNTRYETAEGMMMEPLNTSSDPDQLQVLLTTCHHLTWCCRRSHLLQAEAAAVASLHSDMWPLAQPDLLKQVLQRLHVVQQDMVFHAQMSKSIQVAARTSRYRICFDPERACLYSAFREAKHVTSGGVLTTLLMDPPLIMDGSTYLNILQYVQISLRFQYIFMFPSFCFESRAAFSTSQIIMNDAPTSVLTFDFARLPT